MTCAAPFCPAEFVRRSLQSTIHTCLPNGTEKKRGDELNSMASLQNVGLRLVLLWLVRCKAIQADAGSLTSYLIEALEIDIPDSSTKIGLDTLRFRHLKCNQCHIGGLQSAHVLPSKLYGELTDVTLHCDGSYSFGLIHGTLEAAIKISSLALRTAVSKDPWSQYPSEIYSLSCRIPSFDVRLKFSGGAAGAVLTKISPFVKSMVEGHVKSKVCARLMKLVSVAGTQMIVTKIRPAIGRVLDLGTPDIPESSNDSDPSLSYVHWADSLLGSARELLSDGNFGGCFFGKKKKIASYNTNTVEIYLSPFDTVISHLTNGTGKWAVHLAPNFFVDFPSPSDAGPKTFIKFQRMSISGLDTLNVLDALHPSPIHYFSVGNTFFMGHLGIEIDFKVCSEIAGVTLCEQRNSTLMTKLEDVTITMNCSVGAIQKKLNSMHLEDLFNLNYWLSAIDFFNISSLTLESNVKSIAVEYADTKYEAAETGVWTSNLDTGVEYLLDNALHLLISDYKTLMESVIAAAVQGPLRKIANQHIAEMLAKHKTTPLRLQRDSLDGAAYTATVPLTSRGDGLPDFEPVEINSKNGSHTFFEEVNRFLKCLGQRDQESNSPPSLLLSSLITILPSLLFLWLLAWYKMEK